MITKRWFVFVFLHFFLWNHISLSQAAESKWGPITVHFRDDKDPNFDLHNKSVPNYSEDESDSDDTDGKVSADVKDKKGDVSNSKLKESDTKSSTSKHLSSHVKKGGHDNIIADLKEKLLLSANKPKVHNDLLYRPNDTEVPKKISSAEKKFLLSSKDKGIGHDKSKFSWVLSWVRTVPVASRNLTSTLSPDVSPDGVVVVASTGGRVSAFSIPSGDKKWSVSLPNLSAGVRVDGDFCFVVSDEGYVYSLSLLDGHVVWSYHLDATVTSLPVVDDERLLVKGIYGSVVALNRTTGTLLWRFSRTWSKDMVVRDSAPVTISGPYVLVPAPKGQLFILDKVNGRLKFSPVLLSSQGVSDVERMTDLVGSVFYAKSNLVCAVSFLHAVGCYQIDKKIFSWIKDVRSFYGAKFDAENVFISRDDGLVQSLYLASGHTAWMSTFLGDTLLTLPVVFKDYVLVGDRFGRVDVLNSHTGMLVRRLHFSRRASFVSVPRVWGDYVVILSQDGHIFCVHYVKS
ncbi:outer membrane protein assembly factor BamB family protein [Candidatus Ichthyocystis hellenicum]|uniref:outer membrane protein assembly factor BamB family protein n=1 Tax=Candidatus Ichthyocystis hellenicum TaxID=1561003 RepID=UPI000B85688F|nr:PQQ-binding-like beta-propeller repeat protein [Candidatus Ichthyocystis hellenicum]